MPMLQYHGESSSRRIGKGGRLGDHARPIKTFPLQLSTTIQLLCMVHENLYIITLVLSWTYTKPHFHIHIKKLSDQFRSHSAIQSNDSVFEKKVGIVRVCGVMRSNDSMIMHDSAISIDVLRLKDSIIVHKNQYISCSFQAFYLISVHGCGLVF